MSDRADGIRGAKGRAGAGGTASLMTALVCFGLASCSALPDAARPGFIYGSEAPAESTSQDKSFPNLADVPDQAPAVTSASDQQQIASNLASDRSAAQKADAVLRSGSGEVVVASGSASPGAADRVERAAEPLPAAPTMAPAPHTPAPPMPAPATPEQAPASSTPVAAAEPVKSESKSAADEELMAAAASESAARSAPQKSAALAPSLAAGTEAAAAPAAPAAPAPAPTRLAAVEPAPALTPPAGSEGVIPFPTRGGHTRLSDIKGGVQLSEIGVSGSRADVVATEGQDDSQVTAAPTTPVEVQPAP